MATLTERLGGLFRRVRTNGHPVSITVQRHVLEDATESLEHLAARRHSNGNGHGNGHSANGDSHEHGPSLGSAIMSRLPGARRDAAIANLQQGYHEIIELMRALRSHMQQQADRSDRLLNLMQRTTESLQSLPQHAQNQAALIENIGASLEAQARQSRVLNEALNNVARANDQQCQVLGLIHKQISTSRESDQQMLATFDGMNQTLTALSHTNHASAQALRTVTEQSQRSDDRLADILARSQKQMTLVVVTSWIVAAVALAVAAYAVIKL